MPVYFSNEETKALMQAIQSKQIAVLANTDFLSHLDEKWEKRPRLINPKSGFNPDNIVKKHYDALIASKPLIRQSMRLESLDKQDIYASLIELAHSIAKTIEHGEIDNVNWFYVTQYNEFPAEVHVYVMIHMKAEFQHTYFQQVLLEYAKDAKRNTVFWELKKFINLLLNHAPATFVNMMERLEFEHKPYHIYRKVGGVIRFKIIDFVIHTAPALWLDRKMIDFMIANMYTIFDELVVREIIQTYDEFDNEDYETFNDQVAARREEFKSILMWQRELEESNDYFIGAKVDADELNLGGKQK